MRDILKWNTKSYVIGGLYYAVSGQYVDKVKVLNVNKGSGIHKDITYSVDVQIVGTSIERKILTGFIFDSELNARLYVKKMNEHYKVRQAQDNVHTTEELLQYILTYHLKSAKDAKERQFIIEKGIDLGFDVADQMGSIIHVDFKKQNR